MRKKKLEGNMAGATLQVSNLQKRVWNFNVVLWF
jgi:hypothetical protein